MDGQFQRRLVAALVVTTLTACSSTTLSENQCKANDWYTVGYADGSSGYDASRLLQHHHACVEHGVTPDRAQYTAGWDAGIAQYCTPENGFDLGESGASYNRICPAGFEHEFHAAYSDGHTLYIARSELYEVESAIEQRSARIQQMQVEMQYAVDALIAPETTDNGPRIPARAHEIAGGRARQTRSGDRAPDRRSRGQACACRHGAPGSRLRVLKLRRSHSRHDCVVSDRPVVAAATASNRAGSDPGIRRSGARRS